VKVKQLIKDNNNVNVKLFNGSVNIKSKNGATLLHAAAFAGRADMVEWLIDQGIDVNAEDDRGRTPLSLAAGNNIIEELLKKHGALELNH
jgi:ankyrin repeat protein